MQPKALIPQSIQYNAATNMFEALVTLITANGQFRYPCAVEGSLYLPPSAAAFELTQQAKSRHVTRTDLHACTQTKQATLTDPAFKHAA